VKQIPGKISGLEALLKNGARRKDQFQEVRIVCLASGTSPNNVYTPALNRAINFVF